MILTAFGRDPQSSSIILTTVTIATMLASILPT
jgi:hypothetical protein